MNVCFGLHVACYKEGAGRRKAGEMIVGRGVKAFLVAVAGLTVATWFLPELSLAVEEKQQAKLPEAVAVAKDIGLPGYEGEKEGPAGVFPEVGKGPAGKLPVKSALSGEKATPGQEEISCQVYESSLTGRVAIAFQKDKGQYHLGLCKFRAFRYGEAIAAFETLATQYPDSAYLDRAMYWTGESHFRLYNWGKALESYQKLLEKWPQSEMGGYAYYSSGWIYLMVRKDYERGARFLGEFAEKFPPGPLTPGVLLLLGLAEFNTGRYVEAHDAFQKVVAGYSGSEEAAESSFWVAEALFYQGGYSDAVAAYKKFLEAYPDSDKAAVARYGMAWSQMNAKDYEGAAKSFEDFIRFDPGHPFGDSAYFGEIKSLVALGREGEAYRSFEWMKGAYPKSQLLDDALIQIAWNRFVKREYGDAEALANRLLEEYPGSDFAPVASFALGEIYYRKGEYGKAVVFYGSAEATKRYLSVALDAGLRKGEAYFALKDYAAAADQFRALLGRVSDSEKHDEVSFWLGESLYYLASSDPGYYTIAARAYAAVSDKSDRYDDALYGLAWLNYRQEKWEEAAGYFGKIVEELRGSELRPDAIYRLAESSARMMDYKKAEETYRRLIEEYPQDVLVDAAKLSLGSLKMKEGDLRGAVEIYSELLVSDPDGERAPDAQYNLGLVLFKLSRFKESRNALTRLIERYPKSPLLAKGYLLLGDTSYNLKDYGGAIREYKELVRRFPGTEEATKGEYGILLSYYSRGEFYPFTEGATKFVKKYPENPLSPALLNQVAEYHYSAGDRNNALSVYSELVARFPKSEFTDDAELRIADIYFGRGDYGLAVKSYLKIGSAYPNSFLVPRALFGAGRSYYEMKNRGEALGAYEEVVRRYQESEVAAEALYRSGLIYLETGQGGRAMESFTGVVTAYKGSPFEAYSYFQLGKAGLEASQYEEAAGYFKKVVDAGAGTLSVEAQYNVGEAYFRAGDYERSAAEYLRAANDYGSGTEWYFRSLLKVGESYERLKRWLDALGVYEKALKEGSKGVAETARAKVDEINRILGGAQ